MMSTEELEEHQSLMKSLQDPIIYNDIKNEMVDPCKQQLQFQLKRSYNKITKIITIRTINQIQMITMQ